MDRNSAAVDKGCNVGTNLNHRTSTAAAAVAGGHRYICSKDIRKYQTRNRGNHAYGHSPCHSELLLIAAVHCLGGGVFVTMNTSPQYLSSREGEARALGGQ